MSRMLPILATFLLPGAPSSASEAPTTRAWLILQQDLTSGRTRRDRIILDRRGASAENRAAATDGTPKFFTCSFERVG
jgi:hypothetical protein